MTLPRILQLNQTRGLLRYATLSVFPDKKIQNKYHGQKISKKISGTKKFQKKNFKKNFKKKFKKKFGLTHVINGLPANSLGD
jgi:hypothetical protein